MPKPPLVKASRVTKSKSDFARGYFGAVSVPLRETGCADTFVKSLFAQGGNPELADACDVALFREHGLMK